MMISDPVSDMLIRIKNAYLAHHKTVIMPHSKLKEALAKLLKTQGFIGKVSIEEEKHKKLAITLRYHNDQPVLQQVKRISKPGRRVYVKKQKIPRVQSGFGIAVISTPSGLMTGKEAKKEGLGGEVICIMW